MAAFRETYSELHELRSLTNSVKIIALTATATTNTKETIIDVHIITESPDKPNVAYSVYYMPKNKDIEEHFQWLIDELLADRQNTTRTIIYCQTIKQCGLLYSSLRALLGNDIFLTDDNDPRHVLLEMLHSCTPAGNKEAILHEFQNENSGLRVLIATIAFGMGVDCKGVSRIVHFGPSKNIEAYIQETGRAGRDGRQSVAYVIYQGLLLNHVDKHVKTMSKLRHAGERLFYRILIPIIALTQVQLNQCICAVTIVQLLVNVGMNIVYNLHNFLEILENLLYLTYALEWLLKIRWRIYIKI